MKKYYTFKSVAIIEAENEEEARLDFADNSFDFAANAECIEHATFEEAMKI